MMKIDKKYLNFHTFAIDNIRLSKTYPKSLKISRIDFQYKLQNITRVRNCLEVSIHESLGFLGHGHAHVGQSHGHCCGSFNG